MENGLAVGDLRHRLGGYRDHAPPPELAAVAEGAWVYRTPEDAVAGATHRVLPDPAVSIAFWCRRERDGRPAAARLVLIGAKTRPHLVAFEPGCEISAVRLKLEWIEPLLGLLPAEHHDAEHDLSLVLPRMARPLLDALGETWSAGPALALLTGALGGHGRAVGAGLSLDRAARALELVRASGGRLSVERVADHVGASLRQLRRSVRRAGVSLKTYARTTRFLRAVTAADCSAGPAWARIAADAGYCDQSHLVRDCRALAGMTPSEVHRERRAEVVGLSLAAMLFAVAGAAAQEQQPKPLYTYEEVMIPVRDGVHLQTVILAPVDQSGPLPILFTRTPYGVPSNAPTSVPPKLKELARDGDSIDWLVGHVKNNNGKVGMMGVSFEGLTTALTLLHPHPALKAISEQASPVDEWMNDDNHRYGALRESYTFEGAVLAETDKNKNTNFQFEIYDSYSWYLAVGPLSNINSKYVHGSLPYWNDVVAHPDYDDFWKKEAWVRQLHASTVPNLNVAGFWDQEDPWGPWQIFRHAAEHDPDRTNLMVAGPWHHGEWQAIRGDSIGLVGFGGHETAREFRETIEAPFFRYYLHGTGEKPSWLVTTFESGANRWRTYAEWPPKEARPTNLYFHADGSLSFDSPAGGGNGRGYREYVSDPASPVPYRARPISPTYPGGDWKTWEVADQRFVAGRPDVLTYVSAPLEHDLRITGEVAADLFASTSGTDADFVVKLIDAYPEAAQPDAWDPDRGPAPGEYARSMNGYQLPIAMEVRRGRYLASYEHPRALTPDRPTEWKIPLRDRDHVFLKGHRLMVQVQSTWFPVIDRNPQKFVRSIYQATSADFVKATQRVYCTPALPSHLVLPVVP